MAHAARTSSDFEFLASFFEVVQRTPQRTAIAYDGILLSYADLGSRVLELASRLGNRCGSVAVFVTRSPETIIALLAVMAAGGTYCPIDPTFPAERQQLMARLAECKTVICTAAGQQPLPGVAVFETSGQLLQLDPVAARSWKREDSSVAAPAYILTTSGSSGAPKAVVTSVGAINTAVHALRDLFEITPEDRVLQFASLNWDTCFEEILPTLSAGATLVLDREAYTGSLPRLLRMLDAQRVSVVDLPTAFWHELVYYLAEERLPLPSALRLVVIGGEAARPLRVADWSDLQTDKIRLLNTYGCTETTLVTHSVELHGPLALARDWRTEQSVPIGTALPHVLEYVDTNGDLFIGGPSLALGYSGDPELTDERFVQLRDSRVGWVRYFRTGDRVARDSHGDWLHLGRADGQLKVRGIRVDPAEVEAQIATHAAVAAVAVTGVTVASHTALKAYIVPRAGVDHSTLVPKLLAHLVASAPSHLVPSQITLVPELVYTASGKIDRAASHKRHAVSTKQQEIT
jgi:amino acid adenylation domain-containing protein